MSVKLQSVPADAPAVAVATGTDTASGIELLVRSAISYASPSTHG